MTGGLRLVSWQQQTHHHHSRGGQEKHDILPIIGHHHHHHEVWLNFWQTAPQRIWRRIPKSKRIYIYIGIVSILIISFFQAALNGVIPSECPIVNGKYPARLLECNSQLWEHGSACGINGRQCWPSDDLFTFRCPSNCKYQSTVYDNRMIGNKSSLYKPYIIGPNKDTGLYRGDSFICAAALHAGVISNIHGGCGILEWSSEPVIYDESLTMNGLTSTSFDGIFPISFKFQSKKSDSSTSSSSSSIHCTDWRHEIITCTIISSLLFGYIIIDPIGFFWPLFIITYWCIILVSDPPSVPITELNPLQHIIMIGWSRFIPIIFIGFVIFNQCVLPLLNNLQSQLSKVLLYIPSLWCGILLNYTFDRLPIDRFTSNDLNALPGAKITAFILSIIVIIAAIGQIRQLNHEKIYSSYKYGYILIIIGLILLAICPNILQFRMHHYLIALLLLPGTIPKCSMSLIYQGFLIGLFINGIAKWGFASILETPTVLARGSTSSLSFLDNCTPSSSPAFFNQQDNLLINAHINRINHTLTASWNQQPTIGTQSSTGYSLIINDVERYRGPNNSISLDLSINGGFWGPPNLIHHHNHHFFIDDDLLLIQTLYIRLAMVDTLHNVGEYSKPQRILL